ncbi:MULTISPECIES: Uma2 family endonuclease [Streptomyces]|uniref:Uma2 family endonuclease n=1 Tax=Streptomyces TaxID=1883 RepID=UPI001162AF40|nr:MULTISPECIES: Uma2 family endonuclease [unclassified Streptomyces]NMI59155.1 Uma2 family endonuclease [Streptomyces sp. RLA2-12]QDN58431.1 Uma2 family endonuclease [Streptomyces sp. S1D4-20]QDN68525.1 Uma2 family endonuclease [Streptomyces sp. S1D4-14]QDO50944.1 Uma2 family endonuclease [Streptomyces sp. RLB3-5]QDO61183.1 Uma2 family endonuclease [Streptomyces sp. RLB1-8]
MTVLEDRIEMADANTKRLDEWFQRLERMPVPEGFRVEIVGGTVHMTPQRDTHWEIIRRIVRSVEDRFGMDVKVFSDVRIDFPGRENGFCPDVAKLSDSAKKDDEGRWHYKNVEFIAEVISQSTASNDYGPKKTAYALAEVPVYLIADPYQGRCHLFTQPKDGEYVSELSVTFGVDIDLTTTPVGLTLKTDEFPRD